MLENYSKNKMFPQQKNTYEYDLNYRELYLGN